MDALKRFNHACFPALASVTGELRDARRGTSPAGACVEKEEETNGRLDRKNEPPVR